MRMSELSRATGVPVATVKYYLREGLLHEGRLTSATQAHYDDTHVARLQLVRALLGVGGLSVAAARAVLDQLSDPPESMFDLLGGVQHLIGPEEDDVDTAAAAALIEEWGWRVGSTDQRPLRRLAAALAALDAAGFALPPGALADYGRLMRRVAELEIAGIPAERGDAAIRYVVLGTILVEPLLLALRRLAHIDASARRFDDGDRADEA